MTTSLGNYRISISAITFSHGLTQEETFALTGDPVETG